MVSVAEIPFTFYKDTVQKALDEIGAESVIPQEGLIILKPNLVNTSPPPVTTPADFTEAVYLYIREKTKAKIIIGEGSGSGTTDAAYGALGYDKLAAKYGLELVDFNTAESVKLERKDCLQLASFFLPKICLDAFVVSLPVLKDHSFTGTTIAMKNMFGLAPARHYGGSWNKSVLHSPSADKSVVDICLYKKPGLSVVDAVTVLTGMHLSGTPKNLNLILASLDPVAVDARGSELLGHNPRRLAYLTLAEKMGLGRIG